MLCAIGYAIVGIFAYESIFCNNKSKTTQTSDPASASQAVREEDAERFASTVIYHIKSGEGEINLPPCKLMAVELGPSIDPNKSYIADRGE